MKTVLLLSFPNPQRETSSRKAQQATLVMAELS